ncbi:YkgJ family cysteine cluster protein [Desulfatitalea alkaliphila]|uniref:YkgJ family cysteine cluster protein n=1 Tax=Desulfatitalea alkaliphila TaxID=2929485 RepID=A0AA41R212_9BACT|nr:YkgJ family cysteine cluster protein [Desulfatitalea alkaliphila]MCJ8501139.1 YkgJ family cysteine cluster protein [Desulfatitalea alkaliphila]
MPHALSLPSPLAAELAQLFVRMDAAYGQAARQAGFACRGCAQNCCRSLFFHYTLAEYLYLKAGLEALPAAERATIRQRAEAIPDPAAPAGVMCPLNAADRCLLYAQRPMICRLHGIPHRLRRPDGKQQIGQGCDDFYRQCGKGVQPLLDRTPLYVEMARLERALRGRTGYGGRIRMTVAQMILAVANGGLL